MAALLPAAFLPSALTRITGALLPTKLEDAAELNMRDRRLSLTPLPDGGGLISGQLTGEAYELLHTALSAAMDTDPDNTTDTDGYRAARDNGWHDGDPLPQDKPVRSRPQRMHDALVLSLRSLLDAGCLGTRGKQAPYIGVTLPLGALNAAPGALPAVGDSGQPLPLSLVRQWMHDAWITRFVLDLKHRVIEASHRERTLKAHERAITDTQTGRACHAATCRYGPNPPPGVRIVPHHQDAWQRTGITSLSTTVPLCEADHHHPAHGPHPAAPRRPATHRRRLRRPRPVGDRAALLRATQEPKPALTSARTWDECLTALEQRTGMYVPPVPPVSRRVPRRVRPGAAAARPSRGFSDWMSARHAQSSLWFTALALIEYTGREQADEYARFT
jgi:hypothetical protein